MAANILVLSMGAIIGATFRFLITHYSSQLSHHHGFPYGTLIVNVLGSFAVGFILTWTADHEHDYWRLFAATGFCGAFTTFSAFAYESVGYLHEGNWLAFGGNVLVNNVLCCMSVALGIWVHGVV